jgi:hypothetical protein
MARLNRENYVFRRNPAFEHARPAIDWQALHKGVSSLPSLFRSTLVRMKHGQAWEHELFLFYTQFCVSAAQSFGVSSGGVEMQFDLDLPRTLLDDEGYMHTEDEFHHEIHLSKLKFADLLTTKAFWGQESNPIFVVPTSSERSNHLALMLVYWLQVTLHEMYHVRQSVQTPLYSAYSGWAASRYADGKPSLYYRDLGERSAEAVKIRGLLEIEKALNNRGVSVPIQLDIALNNTISIEQEALADRSAPFPSGGASWRGEIFKPIKKKKTRSMKRD